ncbi:hypothetical protein BDB00DRAFT_809913 [Zychaea mexicana]|uniref:uncharacterized protein n=1 Tax=Zychaea mexicana TaxID=64656 RepID=UPI0022FE999C|nr:uncharacterized protein BDB00DRAFT_809913 [Zychaea mexicana]KAI9496308.1 hypothetical protein BDB00DRAFT_809913 [Zychaea mexicana]
MDFVLVSGPPPPRAQLSKLLLTLYSKFQSKNNKHSFVLCLKKLTQQRINMANRLVASSILRQRSTLPGFISAQCQQQQRCLQVSATKWNVEAQPNERQQSSAATMTNKFIAQARKERNIMDKEPTPFVQLENLPSTTTMEDIRKLAREALPEGDKSINEVVFVRQENFDFKGRCIVSMKSAEDAQRVIEYGNRRVMGGNVVKMSHVGNLSDKVRTRELRSVADQTSASGRSVTFSGLPMLTQPEHLLGYLRSRNFYPVEGTADSIIQLETKKQATVSKFLVKFDTESEAWRAVRRFHNDEFLLNKRNERYKLNVSVVY